VLFLRALPLAADLGAEGTAHAVVDPADPAFELDGLVLAFAHCRAAVHLGDSFGAASLE